MGGIANMDEKTLAGIIGAVQGIRGIADRYRDELGGDDLMLMCYALEAMESELFDLMDALIPCP